MRRAILLGAFAIALWASPGAFAAGWCGGGTETPTDRPEVVTGQQVHAVVALAADAPDTFPAEAARLADDVASITTWWQGQDPTRVPRFDQAVIGGVSCLDISFVRLSGPAAQYGASGASGAFTRIASEIAVTGLGNSYKKYLVYYAGPSVEPDVCGTGAGDLETGRSYAVVWLRECTDVPSDTVAAHELLHAFGALPFGSPHACGPGQGGDGHPCDSTTDILYPFASGGPISSLVLDFNHDDYYGHAGTQDDIQDSLWLHRVDAAAVTLSVALSGGPGRVTSDVPGVDCAAACSTQWDANTEVRLSAVPRSNDRFVRWTGSCTGNADCVLKLSRASSATAVFGPLRIPLRVSSAGKGRVMCVPRCGKTYGGGDPLTLRAIAAKGWRFTGWTGACKGKGAVCRPKTDYALATRAVFKKKR